MNPEEREFYIHVVNSRAIFGLLLLLTVVLGLTVLTKTIHELRVEGCQFSYCRDFFYIMNNESTMQIWDSSLLNLSNASDYLKCK